MKKLVKDYFLFFAEAPLFSAILTMLSVAMVWPVVYLLFVSNSLKDPFFIWTSIIILVLILVNAIAILLVTNKYIMVPNKEKNFWFYITINDGKVTIVNSRKPFWKNLSCYIVFKPSGYKPEEKKIYFDWQISGMYIEPGDSGRTFAVSVPVYLVVELSCLFSFEEIFDVLYKKFQETLRATKLRNLRMDSYFMDVTNKSISSKQNLINKAFQKYFKNEMSLDEFYEKILPFLPLPNLIFSNVSSVKFVKPEGDITPFKNEVLSF